MGQNGGYPPWFDNVPKRMSRKKYLRLKKSKPKNKSMKVWIRENNKKNKQTHKRKIQKYNTKRRTRKQTRKRKVSQKGGVCPCAIPAASALFGAGIAGGASFFNSFSSSHETIMNGPKGKQQESSEKNTYEKDRNGKKSQKEISRENNLIKIGKNGTRIKTDSIKSAKMLYNKLKQKYFRNL